MTSSCTDETFSIISSAGFNQRRMAMTNTILTRREREKQNRRNEILKTALDLFSRKGFHNVSMQEIAQNAEFAVGTLYNFFKDKEDIYRVLVEEQYEKFEIKLNNALESNGDEIEKIKNFIQAKGEVFAENAPMIRLYFSETRGARCNYRIGLEAERKERYEKFLRKLAAVFESGIRNRKLESRLDPYYMAVALDSVTNAFLLLWLEDPERHSYSENVKTIEKIFFERLIAS